MNSPELEEQCEGALICMQLCYAMRWDEDETILSNCAETLCRAGISLTRMLFSESMQSQHASAWALVWLGACKVWAPLEQPDVLGRLFNLWRNSHDHEIKRMAGWSLSCQKVTPHNRQHFSLVDKQQVRELSESHWGSETEDTLVDIEGRTALLLVVWHLQMLRDKEIAQHARTLLSAAPNFNLGHEKTLKELLEHLGEKA